MTARLARRYPHRMRRGDESDDRQERGRRQAPRRASSLALVASVGALTVTAACVRPVPGLESEGVADVPDAGVPRGPPRVLLFSRTAGYRHDSIPAARAALMAVAADAGSPVWATEDAGVFSEAELKATDVVVFLLTSGDALDSAQEAALEQFVRGGGGYVGVHSAADTEYGWPFYEELVGAWFKTHPVPQLGNLRVEQASHPATVGLPQVWSRFEEWYDFKTNPRAKSQVLLTLDEGSYAGGTMGTDHPIAWCRSVEAGRAFYSAGGHDADAWAEPLFLQHIWGGIRWVGREGE